MKYRLPILSTALLLAAALPTSGMAEDWRPYADPQMGFRSELPLTSFRMNQSPSGHLSLSEVNGAAVIDFYTGVNLKHLSPAEFADQLSFDGEVKDITYRASGNSWFVLSGHFRSTGSEPELIYYSKYYFSTDHRRVIGFELSYPIGEKARMNPIVDHLEATFRAL